jgi:hypothetical protein
MGELWRGRIYRKPCGKKHKTADHDELKQPYTRYKLISETGKKINHTRCYATGPNRAVLMDKNYDKAKSKRYKVFKLVCLQKAVKVIQERYDHHKYRPGMDNARVAGEWAVVHHIHTVKAERKTSAIDKHENDIQIDVKLREEWQKVQLKRTADAFNEDDKYYRKQNAKHGELLEELPVFMHGFDNEPYHNANKKKHVYLFARLEIIELIQHIKEYCQAR